MHIPEDHPLLLDNIKRQTSSDQYLGSSINRFDTFGPFNAKSRPFDYGEAVRQYQSWVYAAINLNATAVASTDLRLFIRQKPSSRRTTRSRSVRAFDKKTHRYMVHGEQTPYGTVKPSAKVRRKIIDFGEDFEEVTEEHPILDLIRMVNPWFNGFDLLQLLVIYLEATGNAYWHPVFDPALGVPSEIWPMPSQWVQIIPDDDQYVTGYVYGQTSMDQKVFEADEVIHFRTANPSNEGLFYGKGKIEAGWSAITQNESTHDMDLAFSDNQARPDYMAIIKSGSGQDVVDRFEANVKRQLRGPMKAGRFMTITGDVDIRPLSFSPKDMAGRDEVIEEISAVFGVPISLLKANDPNLASAQVGYASWKANTILPLLHLIEQKLNERLLPLFGIEDDAVLAFDNPVPADREYELRESQALTAGGLRTFNEDRKIRGDEALEGGDVLRVNGQSLEKMDAEQPPMMGLAAVPHQQREGPKPVAQIQPSGPTDVFRIGNELGRMTAALDQIMTKQVELQDLYKELRHEHGQAHRQAGVGIHDTATEDAGEDAQRGDRKDDRADSGIEDGRDSGESEKGAGNRRDTLHSDIVWKVDAEEDVRVDEPDAPHLELSRELSDLFDRQLEVIRSAIAGGMPKAVKAPLGDLKNSIERSLAELSGAFAEKIRPIIERMFGTGGSAALAAVQARGLQVEFDVFDPTIAESIKPFIRRLLHQINNVTLAHAMPIIRNGLEAGSSVGEMTTALEDTGKFNRARAQSIARTESARAYVAGEEEGWKQSDMVEGKKWLLAPNACEFCRAAAQDVNSRKVTPALGQPLYNQGAQLTGTGGGTLKLDFDDVQGPPLHPNCRCDLVPVFKEV